MLYYGLSLYHRGKVKVISYTIHAAASCKKINSFQESSSVYQQQQQQQQQSLFFLFSSYLKSAHGLQIKLGLGLILDLFV